MDNGELAQLEDVCPGPLLCVAESTWVDFSSKGNQLGAQYGETVGGNSISVDGMLAKDSIWGTNIALLFSEK